MAKWIHVHVLFQHLSWPVYNHEPSSSPAVLHCVHHLVLSKPSVIAPTSAQEDCSLHVAPPSKRLLAPSIDRIDRTLASFPPSLVTLSPCATANCTARPWKPARLFESATHIVTRGLSLCHKVFKDVFIHPPPNPRGAFQTQGKIHSKGSHRRPSQFNLAQYGP